MKIFVSYTMADGLVTVGSLKKLAYKLKCLGEIYIDILDNDSSEEMKQERVEMELTSSDLVILVDSPKVMQSSWVEKELLLAKKKSLPIIKLISL